MQKKTNPIVSIVVWCLKSRLRSTEKIKGLHISGIKDKVYTQSTNVFLSAEPALCLHSVHDHPNCG